MCILLVTYRHVLSALRVLALVGTLPASAKTGTDIPTHLLGDWDIVVADQWDKEERGLISLRKVPVHAWVQVTREKILLLGREPNSEIYFIEEEFAVTFLGAGHLTKSIFDRKNLPTYELKRIFRADYKSVTVTFAWPEQPRPEGFINPTPENK